MFVPRSFIVINVCNQGKNVCSPCIYIYVQFNWNKLLGKMCISLAFLTYKISIIERKYLRDVYGPIKVNGEWPGRYSDELYQLYKEPKIAQGITAIRVGWLRQLFRADELYPWRKLIFTNPDGTTKVGRSRIRWMGSAAEDLKRIGVNNWKTKTANITL